MFTHGVQYANRHTTKRNPRRHFDGRRLDLFGLIIQETIQKKRKSLGLVSWSVSSDH